PHEPVDHSHHLRIGSVTAAAGLLNAVANLAGLLVVSTQVSPGAFVEVVNEDHNMPFGHLLGTEAVLEHVAAGVFQCDHCQTAFEELFAWGFHRVSSGEKVSIQLSPSPRYALILSAQIGTVNRQSKAYWRFSESFFRRL